MKLLYQIRWSRLVEGARVDTPYFADGRLFESREAAKAVAKALIASGAHASRKGLYVKQLPSELPRPLGETLARIHGVFAAMERLLGQAVKDLQGPTTRTRGNPAEGSRCPATKSFPSKTGPG